MAAQSHRVTHSHSGMPLHIQSAFTRGEDDSEKGEGEEGKWLERKKNKAGKKQRFSNKNTKKSFSAYTHSHTLIHTHTHWRMLLSCPAT